MSFFLTLKTKCYDDKTFGNKKAVILRNHGLLTVGKTVDEAAWWFISMERCCQSQLLAESDGSPVVMSEEAAKRAHQEVGSELAGWFSFQPLFKKSFACSLICLINRSYCKINVTGWQKGYSSEGGFLFAPGSFALHVLQRSTTPLPKSFEIASKQRSVRLHSQRGKAYGFSRAKFYQSCQVSGCLK